MPAPDYLAHLTTLANGEKMPSIHLGTYLTNERETYQAVLDALEVGYRAFDYAQLYENESEVGEAINHWIRHGYEPGDGSGIRSRSDIFFTTKLAKNSGYDSTMKAIHKSIQNCGLGYINLFLLHSPYGGRVARMDSWRAVEDAISAGLVKVGGVSNFGKTHLEELLNSGIRIPPAVNQIEVHPFNTRKDIVSFCNKNNIRVQAYCPLVHGLRMDHEVVQTVAEKCSCTASQVLLRWSVQHGYVPLPKTTKRARMIENANLDCIAIAAEDMASLDALNEGLVADWDPTDAP